VDANTVLNKISIGQKASSDLALRAINLHKNFRINCGDELLLYIKIVNLYLWLLEHRHICLTNGYSAGMDDDETITISNLLKELLFKYKNFLVS